MKNFEQQPDGTFLPTADLMDRVRAKPEQYPDAVSDFSRMSGKTPEEVQAILDNQGSYFGAVGNRVTDLVQGGSEAVAIAAENLLPESVLGEGATAIRDFSEGLDPKFDTEKGMVENITEGVGQALPAVAATIGTGGLAGVAIGAGVSTLTFDSDETLAATLEEVAPGITPDILVPQEGDSEEVKFYRALAANAVTDAISLGAFNVAGKALKGLAATLKEAPATAATAKTAQVAPAGAPTVNAQAAQTVKQAAAQAQGLQIDSTISTAEALTRSQKRQKEILVAKMQNSPLSPVDEAARKKFVQDNMGAASRLWTPKNPNVKHSEAVKGDAVLFLNNVWDALNNGDDDAVLQIVRKGFGTRNAVDGDYAKTVIGSAVRTALHEKGVGFDQMVALIRQTPDIGTRTAAAATLKNYTESIVKLAEIDREFGRAASLQLLNRKKLLNGTVDEVEAAEKYLTEKFGKEGITLFSDKAEFFNENMKLLDGIGYDTSKLITQLDDMFTEFDKMRQGALENMKQNSMVRMNPADKARALATTVRAIKEIQTTALLSQFSTTGLEVATNTFNNLLLPLMEHGIAKGNLGRAGREYAGYVSGFAKAKEIAMRVFKTGDGVVDDFNATEIVDPILSYKRFPFDKNPGTHLALRIAKIATDVALASSEFWKALRAQGLAYADGMEMALASGAGRVDAKKMAKEYMEKQFSAEGALVNPKYRLDVAETAWQSAFDTRYVTGRVGQAIDNVRNRDTVGGLLARSAMPFFRTLVNIGSNSMQFLVPPGLPTALKAMSKSQKHSWLQAVPKTIKALDDFTGANGVAAQARAVGRQRLGMAATMGAYAMVAMNEDIEITGASRFKRWDAKKRAFEEYPANSIIVGETSYDLTRMLPFSAPLMLVGMMRDMEIESQLQLEGGNYAADNGAAQALVDYVPALALTNLTLFQDGAAMQGVFGLFDAVQQAWTEGKVDALQLYAEKYAQQFTPGIVKMAAKNANTTQYEGYDFFSRYAAAAGLPVGLPKLDFVGDPIEVPMGRGFHPFNPRTLHRDSPLHQEFVFLNKTEDLAMVPDKPDAVFDKAFWRKMGVQVDGIFSDGNMPSLTQLETVDGKNAWEAYREYLYQGRTKEDEPVKTGVGKVLIKKGENFKAAIIRTIETPEYANLTPEARAQVWKDIFSFYKKGAKEYLSTSALVTPKVFEGSTYGSPISGPTPIADTAKAASKLGTSIQQTKGSPLDAAFGIQR
jgi:hypothetical protein